MRAGLPFAQPGTRVGLLGGSFDPAHRGHVHITEAALRRFGLDRIWWLVSPGNPLKPHGPAPLRQRIEAARRIMHHPRVEVTGIEAALGTRMTRDTIAALQRLYPGVRFVWLMGADNLVQFDHWDRWQDIAARVPIGVIARPGWRMPARFSRAARMLWRARLPEAQAGQLAQARPPAWAMINLPLNSLSSSAIRADGRKEPT
ncbi:nicotinate-nucleotide adenylyltransferase [Paracoccus aminovorans]|uniref:Probable nicotinate-nucleotide adenylyltransferase n=1 Tax=Paracoccus aminovorans TaxID=34004 RepID=A0A1I3BR22_9RHOB|nr:nicotinate-nucleotide adenylyltransferase [Paracoccus aminovorans]CQR86236.1 nicotinic acid mononucleotide adenylyltransferase [Paracoccus aminovorans]SFH64758.1 nicotinate-nucleotide adenylyltransferase [Paracoccus aminovorans]